MTIMRYHRRGSSKVCLSERCSLSVSISTAILAIGRSGVKDKVE